MKYNEYTAIQAKVEKNVIKNVLVLGPVSKNGRKYTKKCMEQAVPLYAGARVYVDHKASERSASERFGVLSEPRMSKEGIRADLKYLTSHKLSASVEEDVKNNMQFFGLSHCVDASAHRTKDGLTVDAINQVISVDLVDRPATTRSLTEEVQLFEAEMAEKEIVEEEIVEETVEEIVEEEVVVEETIEEDAAPDVTEQIAALTEELTALKASIAENVYVKPRTTPVSECEEIDISKLGAVLRGEV